MTTLLGIVVRIVPQRAETKTLTTIHDTSMIVIRPFNAP
jgi:hypothetical protein